MGSEELVECPCCHQGQISQAKAREYAEMLAESTAVDVDGFVDKNGIKFIGKAYLQPNGKYICLANVEGALARVEVNIKFYPDGV